MAAIAYIITTLRDKFEDKERGATAVEYGLLVALIAAAIIFTVTALGGALDGIFAEVRDAILGVEAGA